MQDLLEAIRVAMSPDATPDARAAGADACRTILAAVDTTPGQAMVATAAAQPSPIASLVGALRGVPPDQLLDLAIAKLRAALPADAEIPAVTPLKFHIVPIHRTGGVP